MTDTIIDTLDSKDETATSKPSLQSLQNDLKQRFYNLINNEPMLFFELKAKCNDPTYELSTACIKRLNRLNYLKPDGTVRNQIKTLIDSIV